MKYICAVCLLLCACGKQMPVPHSSVDLVRKSSPEFTSSNPNYGTTLQVRWLGTASYIMQVGDVLLLTDPFYSYHSMLAAGVGEVKSEPKNVARIANELKSLPKPKAIFIGHSHYDHMLDVAALYKEMDWEDIPIYGSETTRNILMGYHQGLEKHWVKINLETDWHEVAPGLRYQAYPIQHAPHMKGVELFAGRVNQPRSTVPLKAKDFRCGPTYAYVFEFYTQKRRFTIYFTGAATNAPLGFPGPDVPNVDLAILCVPGWLLVKGYPAEFVQRLKAPYIMASHYDDFFQPKGKEGRRRQVIFSDLRGFIDKCLQNADYPTFKEIVMPAVGSQFNID